MAQTCLCPVHMSCSTRYCYFSMREKPFGELSAIALASTGHTHTAHTSSHPFLQYVPPLTRTYVQPRAPPAGVASEGTTSKCSAVEMAFHRSDSPPDAPVKARLTLTKHLIKRAAPHFFSLSLCRRALTPDERARERKQQKRRGDENKTK